MAPALPVKPASPLVVTLTGAAGQIAYSLLPLLANGHVFGPQQTISLRLLDIPPAEKVLQGVLMELEDMAAPLLDSMLATVDADEAFVGADLAILVGAFPRRAGMQRADLLARNAPIFATQARAIAANASPDVKILVVGNPANTNAMILSHCAPSIPQRNISALTRLDHNRAIGLVARTCGCSPGEVADIAIWGNHSATQYPDFTRATAKGKPVMAELGGPGDVAESAIATIQKRGASVIGARGASSALSAAHAIADHCRSWMCGDDSVVSMAVPADGTYNVKEGVWFSFPVRCPGGGDYEIVEGIELDEFSQRYLDITKEELFAERAEALKQLD